MTKNTTQVENINAVAYNIQKLMREKGYTQTELAKRANISQSTLSGIINGANIKAKTASAIASALGVDSLTLQTAERLPLACPVCGSRSVSEWVNHGSGAVRFCCGYCGADTGEQRGREKAIDIFSSFHNKNNTTQVKTEEKTRVLSLAEVMDVSSMDNNAVRPVWFENRGLFIVPSLLQCGIAERELDSVRVMWFDSYGTKTYLCNLYNVSWRCWSQKPTMAQSDSVMWSD